MKYRTPSFEEFIPGFEYELCESSIQLVCFDFSTGEATPITEPKKVWVKKIVPDFLPGISTFQNGEFTVGFMPLPWERETYLRDLLNQLRKGQIRKPID